jgi:hypothetical protein
MTPEQIKHSESIAEEFSKLLLAKYSKGAIEHKGNLWEVDYDKILDYAIEEVIDQAVYLLTLKQLRNNKSVRKYDR